MKPLTSGAPAHPATGPAEPDFDRVARIYRWGEYLALGPLLERTRNQFLPELASAKQALVLGDGDGRFAAKLLSQSPDLRLHAVDSSAAMLHLLRRRCTRNGAAERLTTRQASVHDLILPDRCDLVATHFLLDCLPQPEVDALARGVAAQATAGCRWVLSEFGSPRSRWAQPLAAAYIRLLYLAFRVLTGLRTRRLPEPGRALAAAGFVRTRRIDRLGGFLYAELWELPCPGSP